MSLKMLTIVVLAVGALMEAALLANNLAKVEGATLSDFNIYLSPETYDWFTWIASGLIIAGVVIAMISGNYYTSIAAGSVGLVIGGLFTGLLPGYQAQWYGVFALWAIVAPLVVRAVRTRDSRLSPSRPDPHLGEP